MIQHKNPTQGRAFVAIAFAGMFSTIHSQVANAAVVVFNCEFPGTSFFVTVYDDGSPARIGREQGVGDKGQAYFDKLTGAWIIVEFVAGGTLPSTLTTILKDGTTWHSRHTLDIMGNLMASQESGFCKLKSLN
jgi:hypothetical protein